MTTPQYGDLPEVETDDTEVVHGADGPPADKDPFRLGGFPVPDGLEGASRRALDERRVGPYREGETPAYDPAVEHIVDAMDGWNRR